MTPLEASTKKTEYTELYSRASEVLEKIEIRRLKTWPTFAETYKSNAAAVRAWDCTEDGIEALRLKMQMDRLTKAISACSSLLQVKNNEAKHVW